MCTEKIMGTFTNLYTYAHTLESKKKKLLNWKGWIHIFFCKWIKKSSVVATIIYNFAIHTMIQPK